MYHNVMHFEQRYAGRLKPMLEKYKKVNTADSWRLIGQETITYNHIFWYALLASWKPTVNCAGNCAVHCRHCVGPGDRYARLLREASYDRGVEGSHQRSGPRRIVQRPADFLSSPKPMSCVQTKEVEHDRNMAICYSQDSEDWWEGVGLRLSVQEFPQDSVQESM